jgi:hypothetical protein
MMYKKIIFIAIAALFIVGCRKDENNVQNPNQLNSTDYPTTLGGLESFLVPGYSNFRNANMYGYEYLPLVLSCDHSFCSQSSVSGNPFGAYGAQFLDNNIAVNNTPNAALYSQLYQGVAAMNVFFDRANFYQNNSGDVANTNALRGQAYFLRAYYFYLLECFYGESYINITQPQNPNILGVPLPTTFAASVAQANLPRSSAYQVWTQIITDLDSANSKLAGPPVANLTGPGYITLAAAQAMLGKVYVFTQQYDSAKKYLLDVVNNPAYSLPSFSVYSNSFNGNVADKFNSESLFEINVEQQPDQAGILFSNPDQSLTTDASELWAPTIIGSAGVDTSGNGDGNGGTSTNMGNGYCKFFVHDQSLRRFGFNLPVYSYTHNPNYTGTNSAASPQFIMDTSSYNKSLAMRANQTVDPRLFVCAMEPWVDSCEQPYTVAQYPPSEAAQFPDTIPVGKAAIINSVRADYWGWSFKKFATTTNAILAYGGNDAADLILLRLADVYLLYAEACANTGDNTDALLYINKVNTRAYGGSTAHNYATLTSPTLANGVNDELANDPLKYERYVELFGEGGWYFDVCRWGIGAQEAAYYIYGTTDYSPVYGNPAAGSGPTITAGVWSGSGTQIQAEHFPIPSIEIATDPAIQRNNYPY